MITSYHHGMKHEVSVEQFTRALEDKRDRASIVHAKSVAGKVAKTTRSRLDAKIIEWDYAISDIALTTLAKKYGAKTMLLPFVVALARQSLSA